MSNWSELPQAEKLKEISGKLYLLEIDRINHRSAKGVHSLLIDRGYTPLIFRYNEEDLNNGYAVYKTGTGNSHDEMISKIQGELRIRHNLDVGRGVVEDTIGLYKRFSA